MYCCVSRVNSGELYTCVASARFLLPEHHLQGSFMAENSLTTTGVLESSEDDLRATMASGIQSLPMPSLPGSSSDPLRLAGGPCEPRPLCAPEPAGMSPQPIQAALEAPGTTGTQTPAEAAASKPAPSPGASKPSSAGKAKAGAAAQGTKRTRAAATAEGDTKPWAATLGDFRLLSSLLDQEEHIRSAVGSPIWSETHELMWTGSVSRLVALIACGTEIDVSLSEL